MDNLWIWLVVEVYPAEKYEYVNWDDDIPNLWGKCCKPPNGGLNCHVADYQRVLIWRKFPKKWRLPDIMLYTAEQH